MHGPDLRAWRRLQPQDLRQFLAMLVLGGIMFISATRLNLLPGDVLFVGDFTGAGNTTRQLLYLAGVAIMLVCADPLNKPDRLLAMGVPLLLLLAWCAASMTWSVAPQVGVRRLILAIVVVWLVHRTVDDLGPDRALAVVLYVALGLLLANLAAVAVHPGAIHRLRGAILDDSIVGAWRGVMPEKNGAGLLTATTLLLLCFGVGRLGLLLRFGFIVLAAVFLLGTRSKTSIALVGVGLLAGALFQLYRPQLRPLLLPALAIVLVAVTLAAWYLVPPWLDELDSSLSAFTGRIQIWRVLVAAIGDRPWLGAGYGSVWNVGPTSPIYDYTSSPWITRMIAEGHNGYLDLLMEIGIVGAVLALLVLFVLPIGRLLLSPARDRTLAGLCLALLVFALCHNLTESSILVPDHPGQVAILLAIACIRQLTRPHAEERPASYRRRARTAPPATDPRPA
ncbi:O-antigen ligase family protein [Croceibacterium sp. TMG7-5b_MA50]|uniref:O-antigen ligase family protein n=1 Tax=Croceibacterium sp. TMG7-5b_MA50 TaxID=3121290 RepID=UPI003221C986